MTNMPDWKTADLEMVREMVREAELVLEGQVSFAMSADQRASSLAGIYTATATALVAGVVAAEALSPSVVVGGLVSAAFFIGGAGLCISTVLPTKFHVAGNEPEGWYGDVASGRPLVEALGEQAEHYQEAISFNNEKMKSCAIRYRGGAILGIAAPLAGLLCWLVTELVVCR